MAFLAFVGPIVGLAGQVWWGFELASHFRVQYFWGWLVATAALLALRQWELAGAAGMLLAFHAVALIPFYIPLATRARHDDWFRIVSLNVRRSNEEYDRTVGFIREARPAVAFFLEVDDEWERALARLGDVMPYSRCEPRFDSRGIAVYSRLPLDDIRLLNLTDDVPAIVASVTLSGGPVRLCAMHPYPPISGRMSALRDRQIADLIREIELPVGDTVLIGDFNMTSWSPAFSSLLARTGMRDTRLGRGVQPTWPARLPAPLRIPIDHCLVSPGLQVVDRQTGPDVGSDHLPIVVDLSVTLNTTNRTNDTKN